MKHVNDFLSNLSDSIVNHMTSKGAFDYELVFAKRDINELIEYFDKYDIEFNISVAARSAVLLTNCEPVATWSNPPYTIVQFSDDEKVVVKCEDGKPYDFYSGFCIALAKKFYGGATGIEKVFEKCQRDAHWKSRARKSFNKRIKSIKQCEHERKMRARKKAIEDRAEELRIERAARSIVDKEAWETLSNYCKEEEPDD
jgi:hypothetical protein